MEERLKILNMVRDNKVTPEEAAELLQATESSSSIVENFVQLRQDSGPARKLKITSRSSKGQVTSFAIPLGILKFFHSWFPSKFNFNINQKQLDTHHLMDMVYQGDKGVIYKEEKDAGTVVLELE